MDCFKLTTSQKNIWNLQKYYEDTSVSNLCGAIFYKDKRDNSLMKQALCMFIKKQGGLRLRFVEKEETMQYVAETINEDIPTMKFDSMKEFDRYAEKYAKEPIKLTDSCLYRFVIIEVENKSGVLVVLSHLISDAWTFSLMANQVDMIYRNLAYGENNLIVEADYTEYIENEKQYFLSERYKKDKLFWEEKYNTRPEKSLIKIVTANTEDITAKRVTKKLTFELEDAIQKYCKNNPVTHAVLFELALVIYLSRINSESNVVTIGVPVLNRSNAREKKIAGMFISTMPLSVEVNDDMTLEELAAQITKMHMDIFRHQKYPYSDILKTLREKQNFSGNLYDVMISYQNAKTDTGADTKWYCNGFSEVPFVIHIDNRDGNSSHTINVDYQKNVFKDEREVIYIIERLEHILEQIVREKAKVIRDIEILPDKERAEVLYEFNDTYVEYPREKCIHELFTEQAAKTPDKTALVFEDEKFTYRQLDEMSNALAHFLREKGVKPNDVVPIIAKRSWHVIVAMLGVLKAGGAYMPIDYNYPEDRIKYMLNETNAKLLLCYGFNTREVSIEMIKLEEIDYRSNTKDIANKNGASDLCYALFTSGTTGKPKATLIRHFNLSNFVNNNNDNNKYQCNMVNSCKCVLADTTLTFDISVFELYLSLLNGLTVILSKDMADAHYLSELIVKNSVDVLHITPTKILMLLQDKDFQKAIANVKMLMIGAETFSEELYKTISTYTDAVIYNGYGPTETTIGCSFKRINHNNSSDITIGSPIANTQIYIVDKDCNILPIGVAGELCIAGDGVGKGYLNRPELTAEKFVPNPFAKEGNHHGKVMYHTGDLARWRPDGEIDYLGRIDTQVKIRGLRIELGEIESVMNSFAGIQLTAVADKRDENNRQYLVGYYTSEGEIDEKELRSHLSSKLPKYMVPNYFMKLDAMPMTASGKTDRKNLPLPDFTVQINEYLAPETETEKKLTVIWQKLLKIERVGKKDDFFDLGGDSLVAISMLNEIADVFHSEVGMKDIMENTILEQLAQCIDNAGNIVRIPVTGKESYKLLPQQKAIYAAYSREPDSLIYNMPARITLPDNVDVAKLKQSIINTIRHHKILTSYIKTEGDEIIGVYDNNATISIEQYDEENAYKFVRPFDLAKAPLIRIGFTDKELLFDMHHIVADGETLNIILKDILKEYDGIEVQDEKISYVDYAGYFYSQDMTRHIDYFREQLKCDFEPVMLPETKHPAEGGSSKEYTISAEKLISARDYAKQHNLTDTMVFFGAYGILLSKYSGNNNVLSSIVLKNRIHADTKDMAGMFVNTLPVYFNADGTTNNYMQKVEKLMLGLFEHQELPFASITDAVGMSDRNIINTSFVYQADGYKNINIGGYNLMPEMIYTQTAKFDLMMELTPCEEDIKVRLEYNRKKYDDVLMDRLVEAYTRILMQFDKENLADINVMSDEEYNKVLYEFNDTYVEYPREKCIHELFTEQAAKTPDRTALVFEDEKFTYRQLDEMSNALAHYLREKGVKPNDVVPIIAKRSWHVIVAMLGVLKAGGAYMPVSPEYPSDRINYMFDTANVNIALTYGYTFSECDLLKQKIEIISLNEINYAEGLHPIHNVNIAEDCCYIIFTSGSTGKPKGVAVNHRNVSNYCHNNDNNNVCHKVISEGNESIVSVTNFVFDIFVTESLLPLVNGLTVYFANDEETTSQRKLSDLVVKNNINVIQTTPTKMKSYMIDLDNMGYLSVLKTIILGGEALPKELSQDIAVYSNAKIFNIYGPAETTVWSTNKEINPREKCIHELFTEQAAKTPDRTALVFEDEKFTYRQLDEMSNALAHFLREKGVKPNDVIPIIAKRSWHVIVAMLGVLKAGGAYILIDYMYPYERIKYLVDECEARIVLTYGYEYEYEGSVSLEQKYENAKISSLENVNNKDDIFCVIHTSGSTGKPKVTSLSHKNIAHYISYAKDFFEDCNQVISTTIITFDAFIQETIVALCNGIAVILLNENEITSQAIFERRISQYKGSFLFQTPTKLLNYIRNSENEDFLKAIKSFVLGGEVFPQELYEKIYNKNPDCRIYNIYGPTETTVCCSVNKLDKPIDITIGSPIANTQIYIVDKDCNILPIGVAGELCIAGDGVGKGYLNRPELTAEKFVPNPFAKEGNHHGKVMYHTGDLARWRPDGEIEYLGRIDTQVKIRGLRIELGEIESVMNSFAGIQLTAVADKRDENNRQYLVGYYTSEGEIDEKELRSHLSSKLPKYMVPNYFMKLDAMPMTASGKTDRKNLPLPDFTVQINEYVAPETEEEKKLCKLLKGLLHLDNVGVEDDFFEYGGDSLTAIEYVAKAHSMGIDFTLQNVFDYPTVRKMCNFLNGGAEEKVHFKMEDFDKYKKLFDKNVVDDSITLEKKSLGNVLLTGATGFLGAHILDRLMQEETGKIYCLIRSNKTDDRRGRLQEILRYYFGDKYEAEWNHRIIPVVGDIEHEGLSDCMPSDVQTVIHAAASVKHFGSYSYFHRVNAEGTGHVVEYANSVGARLIHISTLSVSGNSMADDFSVYRSEDEKHFYETSFYIGQPLDNVYIHSKFEAEKRVYDAMLEGLDAVVIRVGNLTNRSTDYKFQPNYRENAFLTRFKAILEFGLFPDYLMSLYSEFSPIDKTAEGIVKLAQYADRQTVFHLNSNRVIYFNRFLEVVHKLDIPMKIVDGNTFNKELQNTITSNSTEYIFEAFQNDMDENGQLVYDSNIRIENDFTLWFLKKLGFEWNETDMEYISGYIEYFRQIGYLEV